MVIQNFKKLSNHKLFFFFIKKRILLKKNFYLINFFYENENPSIINIKITPNNTIINLIQHNKIIYNISAGQLKLKSSKKKYRTISNLFSLEFLKKIKELQIKKNIFIRIVAPKILRHKILRSFRLFNQELPIYQIPSQYVYNGCRVKKIKRKKRKGIR